MYNVRKHNDIVKAKKVPEVEFTSDYKFYLRDDYTKPYVLGVKSLYVITVKKEAYTLDGVKLDSRVDKIINNNLVSRKLKNKKLEISNNSVSYIEENVKLKPIKASDVIKN